MTHRWLCFLFLVGLGISGVGIGGTYYGESSDGFRPRCIPRPDQSTNIFLNWDEKNNAVRKIWASVYRYPCSQWRKILVGTDVPIVLSPPLTPSKASQESYCSASWAKLVTVGSIIGGAVALPLISHGAREVNPYQDVIFGTRISPDTVEALEQVRYGAAVLRSEKTGEEYLANHPLSRYSHADNLHLSYLFGQGFSADIYRAWIESRGQNPVFRRWFLETLGRITLEADPVSVLSQKSRGTITLVSLGMGWDPATAPPGSDIATFVNEIPRVGIRTILLKNHPHDEPAANVEMLANQLKAALETGKDVILVGLSKGSPELLAALARVTGPFLDAERTQRNRPAGMGRIIAYVNLSGLIGGTYFGDTLRQIGMRDWLVSLAEFVFPFQKTYDTAKFLQQLESVSTFGMRRFNARWMGSLPSDATYVTGIGIINGSGFIPGMNSAVKKLKTLAIHYHLTAAANDGFIDYPKNELPEGLSEDQYTVVFKASHMLWDGSIGPYPLTSPQMRRNLFIALYTALLDWKNASR